MYDTEDFDQIQTAEFREAFNEFDKVCRRLIYEKSLRSYIVNVSPKKWNFKISNINPKKSSRKSTSRL